VPQGSVLGLLFFLVYIDEVIRVPLSVGTKLVLYADDVLLYRKIDCPDDYIMLQRDINTINNWVKDNSLAFSVSKCKCMIIYHAKGKGVERVECFKYLVVILTSDLYWDFFTVGFTSVLNHQHYYNFIVP